MERMHDYGVEEPPRFPLIERVGERSVELYHGTSSTFEPDIRRDGLLANDESRNRNFRGSHPGLVYL